MNKEKDRKEIRDGTAAFSKEEVGNSAIWRTLPLVAADEAGWRRT